MSYIMLDFNGVWHELMPRELGFTACGKPFDIGEASTSLEERLPFNVKACSECRLKLREWAYYQGARSYHSRDKWQRKRQ